MVTDAVDGSSDSHVTAAPAGSSRPSVKRTRSPSCCACPTAVNDVLPLIRTLAGRATGVEVGVGVGARVGVVAVFPQLATETSNAAAIPL